MQKAAIPDQDGKRLEGSGQRRRVHPFYLKDDTGLSDSPEVPIFKAVRPLMKPALLQALCIMKKDRRFDPDSTHKRRFQETAIPLHVMLYVTGQSRERQTW